MGCSVCASASTCQANQCAPGFYYSSIGHNCTGLCYTHTHKHADTPPHTHTRTRTRAACVGLCNCPAGYWSSGCGCFRKCSFVLPNRTHALSFLFFCSYFGRMRGLLVLAVCKRDCVRCWPLRPGTQRTVLSTYALSCRAVAFCLITCINSTCILLLLGL